jgi:hypothetical protein
VAGLTLFIDATSGPGCLASVPHRCDPAPMTWLGTGPVQPRTVTQVRSQETAGDGSAHGAAGHGGERFFGDLVAARRNDGCLQHLPCLVIAEVRAQYERSEVGGLRESHAVILAQVSHPSGPRFAHLMAGHSDKADVLFSDAITDGLASGVMVGPCVALAERPRHRPCSARSSRYSSSAPTSACSPARPSS